MLESFLGNHVWSIVILQNTIREYTIALLIFIASVTLFRLAHVLALQKSTRRLEHGTNTGAVLEHMMLQRIHYGVYVVVAMYTATQFLHVSGKEHILLSLALWGALVYQAVVWAMGSFDIFVQKVPIGNAGKVQGAVRVLKILAGSGIVLVGGLLALSNSGINVTALVILGSLFGIAMMLAFQGVFADLCSSARMRFEAFFSVGDRISVGESSGVVSRIGRMTTTITGALGEEYIVPNREITSKTVQVFKKGSSHHAVLSFALHPNTSLEKLRTVSAKIRENIESVQRVRCERVHVLSFDGEGVQVEVAYMVDSSEEKEIVATTEAINLEILTYLREEDILLAHPISTVYSHQIKTK